MTAPDVRIRLSAEGVAEVVAALQKVQAAGQAAGNGSGKSFSPFNGVLKQTTGLLGELLPALSVGAFVGFIAKSSEAAEAVGRLRERTGGSVEGLSALRLAAVESDTDMEGLALGLVRMNKNLGLLKEGSPEAVKSFAALGLSVKSFKGKDATQAFELLSKKIADLPTAAERGQHAMAILGKGGASLLPLMKGVAEEGLGPMIERARQLGVLMDEEVLAATERMNDDFKIIGLQAQGLGIQFATGLSPAISQTFEVISGSLTGQAEGWRNFGKAVGDVIKWVVAIVAIAFDSIGTSIGTIAIRIDGLVRAAGRVLKGDLKGAGEALSFAWKTAGDEQAKLAERTAQRIKTASTAAPPAKLREKWKGEGGPETEPAALAKKAADAANSILETELALAKARNKLMEEADKRAFDQGLISVAEFYRRRRELVEKGAAEERAAIEQKRARLSAEPDDTTRKVQEAKLLADEEKLRLETAGQLQELTLQETDAVRELGNTRRGIEKSILEAQGERHKAALADIESEAEEFDKLLRRQGVSDEERIRRVEALKAALTGAADYDEANRKAKEGMDALDADRQTIQARVENGQLTVLQGEEAILSVEKKRLEALKTLAGALLLQAIVIGDPAKIKEAEDFLAAVNGIEASVNRSTLALSRFKQAAEDAMTSALTDFFSGKYLEEANRAQEEDQKRIQAEIDKEDEKLRKEGASDAERKQRLAGLREELEKSQSAANKLGRIFKAMGADIVQALRQVAAQMLAVAIMKRLAGLFGGGGEVPGVGGEKKAAGGLLRGPGSPTSDNLLIWASPGEFVVRAAVVSRPGIREHLEALNQGMGQAELRRSPRARSFAEGGLVDLAPAPAGGRRDGSLLVSLDRGLILEVLESPEGQRIQVQNSAKNKRALQHAIGR